MKPIKNYKNAPQILLASVEAIEKFQAAHTRFVKTDSEEDRNEMAESLRVVKMLQPELNAPDAEADQIRLAFIKQATILEANIINMNMHDLHPDLYRDSESHFMLMKDIINCFKTALVTKGETVPLVELSSTTTPWKDQGIISFCKDLKKDLAATEFKTLWEALQCYERCKTLLTYTFEVLNITGNLGKE